MASPALFLCIDGGGSKAAAVIADSHGNILARGRGGPSNFKDAGPTVFLSSIRTAVENALESIDNASLEPELSDLLRRAASSLNSSVISPAHSPKPHQSRQRTSLGGTLSSWLKRPSSSSSSHLASSLSSSSPPPVLESKRISLPTPFPLFSAVWIGCAGVDSPQDASDLQTLLAPLFSIPTSLPKGQSADRDYNARDSNAFTPRLTVDNDTALLASPLQKYAPSIKTAVVTIAGTGSVVSTFTETADGLLQPGGRAGGWGWLLGDEGSGFFIGKEALRKILDEADEESIRMSSAGLSTSSSATATAPGRFR